MRGERQSHRRLGNALAVGGRREAEGGDRKGKLDQEKNLEQKDRREAVVRSELLLSSIAQSCLTLCDPMDRAR